MSGMDASESSWSFDRPNIVLDSGVSSGVDQQGRARPGDAAEDPRCRAGNAGRARRRRDKHPVGGRAGGRAALARPLPLRRHAGAAASPCSSARTRSCSSASERSTPSPARSPTKWRTACEFLDEDIRSGYVRVLWELWAAGLADEALKASWRAATAGWRDLLDVGLRGMGRDARAGAAAVAARAGDARRQHLPGRRDRAARGRAARRRRPHREVLDALGDLIERAESPGRRGRPAPRPTRAAPVGLGLRAVAADRHRAPRARAVAGVVVERDMAGVPRARLHALPGARRPGRGRRSRAARRRRGRCRRRAVTARARRRRSRR